MVKLVKPVAGAFVGIALCFSSTVAAAASVPVASTPSMSPFVALSAYGTVQSQTAVCAAAAGTAAAAAAAGQAPGQGCVLPVVDPAVAAPAPVAAAPMVYAPAATSGFGFGIGAVLAGLIAVAGLAAVLLSDKDNGRLPVTPD